jgi:hypothetical protein
MSGPLDILNSNTLLHEDFLSNDAVADATLGSLDWEIDTIANASTWAYQTAHPNGVIRSTTAATANGDGSTLRTFTDGIVLPLNFEFRARLRFVTDVLSSIRIGFDDSVTATDPTKGVGFKFTQGVLSVRTDSAANGDVEQAVTSHPDLTSGTTAVAGSWLELLCKGSGRANSAGGPDEADFYVNGVHVGKLPCRLSSTETVEAKIAHWQASGGAAAKVAEFDYFYARLPILT